MTLREHLADASNDYTALEARYRTTTGGELVLDPYGGYESRMPLTRSATILIGAHDSRQTLRRSLESIERSSLNVRHGDLVEVVVVDDGSTDGTWEMLGALELDLRLRCIRQRRGGLTQAHNTGLAAATGDVVIFSDADIVHTPFALEEHMRRHEVLTGLTLLGFRFDVDASDTREPSELVPAFWGDFRLSFPGHPTSICRQTRHLKLLGHDRAVAMSNGARYGLPAIVVGAFFSVERDVLLAMGGSEERLRGWGCEDSLIGARSIALGNVVVPVYGAASAHVAHARRDAREGDEFARNIRTALAILDEPFDPPGGDGVAGYAARATDCFERGPTGACRGLELPARSPIDDDDHATRALVAWSLGLYGEAVVAYADACAADPRSPWPVVGRAKALRELGDLDAALESFEEARTLDPQNAWVAWERGVTRAARGDHDRARLDVEEARSLSPGFFEPAWALGMSADDHKRRGNEHAGHDLHEIAVRDFDLSLVVDETAPWTHFDRGLSLRALGRADEALSALARAGELLDPDDTNRTWIHGALGELRLERGERALAQVELARALRLFDGNTHAAAAAERLRDEAEAASGLVCTLPLLRRIGNLPGWLSDGEADLLAAAVVRAATVARDTGGEILELGSFFGRSTVLVARTLRQLGSDVAFTAVDPHYGYESIGGVADTYEPFLENLRAHDVEHRVRVVRAASHEVEWTAPLALLFVDALHDYDNVRRDHELFAAFVVPGGLVAFHDYAAWCPGVTRYVDELLGAGVLDFAAHRDGLIVLHRPRAARTNGRLPAHLTVGGTR